MNTNPARKLARRDMAQIIMLSAQLLLGMAVNLIGLPKETSGAGKVATIVFLVLHIGIGVGLLIGSLLAIRLARAVAPRFIRHAWTGTSVITITFASGVLKMITNSNWWSYIMTVGFLGSFLIYGAMFVHADRLSKAN